MTTSSFRTALALVLALAAPAIARAGTTIDFDTRPDGTPTAVNEDLNRQYASLGVTFERGPSSQQATIVDSNASSLAAHSGSRLAEGPGFGQELFGQTQFVISFASAQSLVRFYAGSRACPTGSVTALGAAGALPPSSGHPVDGPLSFVNAAVGRQFTVSTTSPQIRQIVFQANGFGCDNAIDDLYFEGDPPPVPTGPPPTLTIAVPQPGLLDLRGDPVVISGTAQGTNLSEVQFTLTTFDTPTGQPVDTKITLPLFFDSVAGNYIFGSSTAIPAGLPVGHYRLVGTVTDFYGRTGQATVDFANIPASVTQQEDLHPQMGSFLYAVPDNGCQILIYSSGSALGSYYTGILTPVAMTPAITAKWLAVKTPMLAGSHTLGCPGDVDTSAPGWRMQEFTRGRIYVPPTGPTLYTTRQFADAAATIGQSRPGVRLGPEFNELGWPVSDPEYSLDVDDPTWMFQRFDRSGLGPAYLNTLEIRGRFPTLYVERVGGPAAETAFAGLTIDDRTPTFWMSTSCTPNGNGMWPGTCVVENLVPPRAPFGESLSGQDGGPFCQFETAPSAPQWAPTIDNQARTLYEGIIKLHDRAGPDPGSHLADSDNPLVHQHCVPAELDLADEVGAQVLPRLIPVIPGDVACTLGGIFFGNDTCAKLVPTVLSACRSDWNLHTRPTSAFANLMSASNVSDEDFEIEFEAEWARPFYSIFVPLPGDLVSVRGRHIIDCGHADYRAEIHPIDSMLVTTSSTTIRPNHGSELMRSTHGFIWANAFFTEGSVSYSVHAPPRPTPRSQLVILRNEPGYFRAQNVAVSTSSVPGGWHIDLGGIIPLPIRIDSKHPLAHENEWTYPDDGELPAFAYYQDHWMMFWQDPGENIQVANF